ncbi:MAG: CPBP family intramembrane metalloprotease [Candidatus Lokiarchaeota archaeon]|nr:CPBP family intramembrane metalloprotease [Candidatus Lokiarchaeota archaeon]
MGRLISLNRREIASKRFRFIFYEILPIFAIIFILLVLEWYLLPLIVDRSSPLFSIYFYIIRAFAIFLGIMLFLFVSHKLKKKNSRPIKKDLTPHIGFLKLYKTTKKNYTYQLLYSFLLFFLILIPLEFVIAIGLPETMPLRVFSVVFEYDDNFILFLFYSIIIQLSISFSEETVFRGLIVKQGSEHFNKLSAVMISTLYFTFAEVFLNPAYFSVSNYIVVIWFVKSFLIGLVLSLTIIRRKWLLPLILAKTLYSILLSVVVRDYLRGSTLIMPLIIIYSDLLIISLIILILQFSRVKESLQIGVKMIKTYLKDDIKSKESKGDKLFRILFDILSAFLVFLLGFLITV